MSAIHISNLVVSVSSTDTPILRGIDLEIETGHVLGIVGESGSGKSTLGLAMLGYARPGTKFTSGSIVISGQNLLALSAEQVRRARGKTVAYVPQDPGTALNPSLTIKRQLTEVAGTGTASLSRIRDLLAEVGLPTDDAFLARKASELSGGQQQRIGIAMAVVGEPNLVVLDEPTTGLDVTTQLMVLDLVARLTKKHNMAAVYITHDLGVVGRVADSIAVLKDGQIVEQAPTSIVLGSPTAEYTRKLIAAVPSVHDVPATAGQASSAVALVVSDLSASYGPKAVLQNLSLEVGFGECLAIVGESGSGKSTMSRCLIGLHPSMTGDIVFEGSALSTHADRRSRDARKQIQYIFQNPYASLQPRRTIGDSIALPLGYFGLASKRDVRGHVIEALRRVELDESFADRFPAELSGGQRQRAAIARALAASPKLLICDEITSALDVSVQAAILELLRSLQKEGLGMLFITHNLAVVSNVADRVAVLQHGRIVEEGPTRTVLDTPSSPYAKSLIANTLDISAFRTQPA